VLLAQLTGTASPDYLRNPALSVAVLLLLHPFNSLFWESLVKLAPERQTVVDFNETRDNRVEMRTTGPYASHLHLTPHITMPAPHHSVFRGRMLFPLHNQQHQSTEGTLGSHTVGARALCNGHRVSCLSVLRQISKTKRNRYKISSPVIGVGARI